MIARRTKRPQQARCIAPLGEVPDDAELEQVALCGAPAVTARTIDGVECPLCQRHADEIDTEQSQS